MTWPQAFTDICSGLFFFGVVLAMGTDFWDNLFHRGETVEVEVIPESLLNDITEVIGEMRASVRTGDHIPTQNILAWARQLSEAIEDEE